MSAAVALLALALAPPAGGDGDGDDEPAARPWFVDVTAAWGVDYVHDAGFSAEKHLPETMGGGAAVLDADGDGRHDLYFVQSGPLPVGAARERTDAMPPNRLFLANGGRFVDATAESGAAAHRGYGQGVAVGDVDGDGDEDLYVTNFGPDVLLVNDGAGRFADATESAGIRDERWTAGATFFDADADGDLDLYVTGYVQIDVDEPPWCGRHEEGWRSYCHPDHFEGLQDRFWRNDGRGKLVDATEAAGLADSAGKGLGAIAGDFDSDGDVDVYVANDSVENRYWENRGGTFVDATLRAGNGVNGDGATEAGMGLAAGDVDGDGRIDLFVTNFDDESNTLYQNRGKGMFVDRTAVAGLDAPSRMQVGFGCVFEDFDHDGDLDLAVANGHIIDNIDLYHDGKRWKQRAQVYANDGRGRFAELDAARAGALVAEPFVGRALVSGDLDGDGDADLVLVQCGGPARLWRNDAATRPARVLRGLPAGARVEARTSGGRTLARVGGGAPSYYGRCAPEVFLAAPPGETLESVRAWAPGGREIELE